ncbi:ceramidase domain-containing protein, partial [Mesorhizobium sp. M7A.F.Ca.CA.001.06.1.1]
MWQTFLAPVDLYCERTGPEFWSEPVNALTNFAFIAAGLWGVREVRRLGTGAFAEVLAWWVVAIGIGSTIFHTFATKGTVWADVLPIAGFTLAYTLFNLRRFLGMRWGKAIAIFIAFY